MSWQFPMRSGGAQLRAPEDGIVSSSRPGGWLAARWRKRLEAFGPRYASRIARGRTLARGGRVRGLWFSPGLAHAEVIGKTAARCSLRVRTYEDEEWATISEVLRSDLRLVAALLEGELPRALDAAARAAGVKLLPETTELGGDCDCGDFALPCAHMAALHLVLADALDGEPFLLFTFRGRPREQLLTVLRSLWGDHQALAPAHVDAPKTPAASDWFTSPVPLESLPVAFHGADAAPALEELGPPPGGVDLRRVLGPLYEAGAQAARELALAETDTRHERRHAPVPRRRSALLTAQAKEPTMSPTPEKASPSEASGSDDLSERLVNALSLKENVKSTELAKELDEQPMKVRHELIALEKMGIVYRTGNTRGTRWWLG